MKHAISKITGNELTYDQLALVKNLKTLVDFRSGYFNIDVFAIDDVQNLMYTLSVDIVTLLVCVSYILCYYYFILLYTFSV